MDGRFGAAPRYFRPRQTVRLPDWRLTPRDLARIGAMILAAGLVRACHFDAGWLAVWVSMVLEHRPDESRNRRGS